MSSPGTTRTYDSPVNSRLLCQLSYGGSSEPTVAAAAQGLAENLPGNFMSKVAPSTCIIWTGALNSRGYGCFGVGGVSQLAHRVAWEAVNGPIPDGLTVDHVECRNRRCVRPDHMELVTSAENARRAHRQTEFCVAGHPLSGPNLYVHPKNGYRECRLCRADTQRKRRAAPALASP